jgi:hypothetical protein
VRSNPVGRCLAAQGRISDAVVRVLEDKDIAVTVALLEQLTPSQVASACSRLERLCITQQLAADMSVNIPIEVSRRRSCLLVCYCKWLRPPDRLTLSLCRLFSGHRQARGLDQEPRAVSGLRQQQ